MKNLILILMLMTTPLMADWTGSFVKDAGKGTLVFTFIDDTSGTTNTITHRVGRFDGCKTSATKRALACAKQWLYFELQKRNSQITSLSDFPDGPITGAIAPPHTPVIEPVESVQLRGFALKIQRLKGCDEGVRLGVLGPTTCDNLKSSLATRWTQLNAQQKLVYLEHIR